MSFKEMKLGAILMLSLGLGHLQAQDAIVASGNNAYGHGGSASYSVGQILYNTYKGADYSEAQGVQQPYEISTVSDPDEAYNIVLSCTAYPNPVIDFLTLQIDNYIDENINYLLYDISGKILTTGKVEKKKTLISMSEYVPATYYLKVVQDGNGSIPRKTKIFKIIQNKR
jgi:hypothetical protein